MDEFPCNEVNPNNSSIHLSDLVNITVNGESPKSKKRRQDLKMLNKSLQLQNAYLNNSNPETFKQQLQESLRKIKRRNTLYPTKVPLQG